MKSRKKARQKTQPQKAPEYVEQAVDLPDREVMTLIDPNLLGGGLLGGATGGTPAPTDPSGVPTPQPGTNGGTVNTGLGALDKFMPSTTQAPGTPYDPSTSSSSQT